eukprot:3938640-Rhodomonas_salina.1
MDRLDRFSRALLLTEKNSINVYNFFTEIEGRLSHSIKDLECNLQNAARIGMTDKVRSLTEEIEAIKREIAVTKTQRDNISNMIYRCIRDTYNADALPGQQIDGPQQ